MNEGTKVMFVLRCWFAIEVVFTFFGIVSVGLNPANSAENFAWNVQPPVTAAMLGGFYMSIAPILILAIFAKTWETVRIVIVPAWVFTTMLLLATWIHWDKFLHGTPAFNLWYISYLLPPFVFSVVYFFQWRKQQPVPNLEPMGGAFRAAVVILGLIITAEGLYTFLNPSHFVDPQAFAVTPLTARTLGGWITAVGLLMLFSAIEGAYERTRVGSLFLILPLPVVGMQMARFADEVDWTHPRLLIMAAVALASSLVGLRILRGSR